MKTQININPGKINLEAQNVTIKDTNNRITATNVEGALDEIKKKIDEHAAGTNHKHSSEHINYSGKVTGQSSVKGAVDALKSQLDAVVVGGTDVDPRVSQALVDIEAETHQTLKARNDKWEQRIIQIENNTKEAQTTPEIYNVSDIFTVGVGTDSEGNPLDYSESVVKGQISVVLKGETRTNILSENQASVETDTSGFSVLQQSTTLSKDTTKKVFGSASLKIQTTGTTQQEGVRTVGVNCKPNTKYAGSVYLKGSGTVQVRLVNRYPNDVFISNIAVKENITLTSNWQRIFVAGTSSSDAAKISLIIDTGNSTQAVIVYADGFMIEEGENLNNWIAGTKSTVSASRLKSVGKNLFDKNSKLEINRYLEDTGRRIASSDWCITDYIKVEGNTTYISSGYSNSGYNPSVGFFDNDYNFISGLKHSGTNPFIFTTPSNCAYIRESIPISDIESYQLERGTAATPYEPYTESNAYIVAKKDNKIVILRSLPNGVSDRIYRKDNGEWEVEKNVSESLANNFFIEFHVATNNYYGITIYLPQGVVNFKINNYYGIQFSNSSDYIDYDGLSFMYWNKADVWVRLKVPKSAFTSVFNLEEAKQWLEQNNITLTYQLATPVEIPIDVEGSLECYPGGTIIVEPYIADKFLYNNGIDLPKPVSQIDIIKGIVDDKWVELSNNYTLSEDGKTLTIDGIENGQYVKVYAPIKPEESTSGIKVMKFPCNLKAQVESNMKQANRANLRIDDLDDFVTAMLLNHEIRLTLLEGGSL